MWFFYVDMRHRSVVAVCCLTDLTAGCMLGRHFPKNDPCVTIFLTLQRLLIKASLSMLDLNGLLCRKMSILNVETSQVIWWIQFLLPRSPNILPVDPVFHYFTTCIICVHTVCCHLCNIHPSIFTGGAGAYPSWHWVRGGVDPGQVASLSICLIINMW